MNGRGKLLKVGKAVGLVVVSFFVAFLIAGAIPGTTEVRRAIETGHNCRSEWRQVSSYMAEYYPDWRYVSCENWRDDGEGPWFVVITRDVSLLRAIYWDLTGYAAWV